MIFKYSIDKNLEDYEKLNEILKLMKTFIEYQNGYLVDNIELLTVKLCNLTNLSFDETNPQCYEFTRQLFDLCKTLILCDNVKFPVEKIRFLTCKHLNPKLSKNLRHVLNLIIF